MEKRYDRVIIEFQKDNQCVVSAALSDADLDLLQNILEYQQRKKL